MSDTPDEVMASAQAGIERRAAERLVPAPTARGLRVDPRRVGRAKGKAVGIVAANAVLLVLAAAIGLATPLGMFGALALFVLMIAVTALIAFAPARTVRAPAPEQLRTADLKALPSQTERWLAAQRPALPAPAVTLVDRIGERLRTLEPQLAGLDAAAPAGEDVRKLVAEQLPDFVRGYQRVPDALRTVPRNGRTPDAQLVDGLSLIDRQLGEMSEQLAQGDLDALSTRGRYLEIKYRSDGEPG